MAIIHRKEKLTLSIRPALVNKDKNKQADLITADRRNTTADLCKSLQVSNSSACRLVPSILPTQSWLLE